MGFLGMGDNQSQGNSAASGSGYAYANSKGVTYYLHERAMPNGNVLHFFSKDPAGAVALPPGYDVIENPKTGLPFIKKK